MRARLMQFGWVLAVAGGALAGAPVLAAGGPHIEVELVADRSAVRPAEAFTVALRLQPEPGWHTYWRNPGDSGLATRLQWQASAAEIGPIQWPYPQREEQGPLVTYGYSGEHFLPVEVRAPAQPQADRLQLAVQARWLVCREICIPGAAELQLALPYAEDGEPSPWAGAIERSRRRVPRPLALNAHYAVFGDQVQLRLAEPLPPHQELAFFPITPDIVANAPVPQIRRRGELVEVRQPLSEYYSGQTQTLEAVFVLDGEHAVQIRAQPRSAPPDS